MNDTFNETNVSNEKNAAGYDNVFRVTEEKKDGDKKIYKKEDAKIVDGIDTSCHIEVEPETFEAYSKITRSSNSKLSHLITSCFSKVFFDIDGAYIRHINDRNKFEVDLWFTYNPNKPPKNKIRAMETISNANKDQSINVYDKIHACYEAKQQHHNFTLSREARCLLAEFMYGGANNNKPNSSNWNKYIEESTDTITGYGQYYRNGVGMRLKVTGFNIYYLLRMIYGNQITVSTRTDIDSDGNIRDYNIKKPASYEIRFAGYSRSDPNDFFINIEQYDQDGANKIQASENPGYVKNGARYYS